MIASFLAKIGTGLGLKLLGALAALGTVAGILFSARQSGKNAERVDGMKKNLKAAEKRNEVEREVERRPADAVHDRLRDKWTRD